LGVLEVIENENLMQVAKDNGRYLMEELKKIEALKNVRGYGLMIGFDVPGELKDLKKNLLYKHKIFTGEAKPNVIRLLPSLALTKNDADKFLKALKEEVAFLVSQTENISTSINA
jgi:acetylornithine aminotransferase